MKFSNYLFFALLLVSFGCGQNAETSTTSAYPETRSEQEIILEFIKINGLNMKASSSGMHYEITNGEKRTNLALPSDTKVVAHYHGTFLNGKVFDSSVEKNRPFAFEIGSVIPGWREAIRMMEVGDKGTFLIPSKLAYGKKGYPGLIGPNTVLKFEIEFLGIKGQE